MTRLEEITKEKEALLSNLAVKDEESKSRKYKVEPDSNRSDFQRDRDRILYASSFRRLAYKTQVFVYNRNSMHRTRLTHSLEVAQLSTSIAQVLRMNADLCEAIGLAHDLGHSPFGHAGEYTLNYLLNDEDGFEHNEQSLRVVDYIEKRFPEHSGLNLTFAVREGIIKHKTCYDAPSKQNSEFEQRNTTIETEIVSISDRISYNLHDIEDGIREKILSFDQLEKNCSLWVEISESINKKYSNFKMNEKDFFYRCKSLILKKFVEDIINTTLKNIEKLNLSDFTDVISLNRKESIVTLSDKLNSQLKEIENFLYKNLYESSTVVKMNDRAKYFLISIFERYKKNFKLLPENFLDQLPADIRKNSSQKRLICDYIAGMTDAFVLKEYKDLFEPDAIVVIN